jgi:L-rhamnose-H+ transport protein
MEIIIAVILAMLAGIMNGSYAFPLKTINRTWPNALIWFIFSILTFLIMPWITNFCINIHSMQFISYLPNHIIWIELISGFIFGLGMVLFTFSLNYIGIGISFLLNIGTGTVIATLLPILVRNIDTFKTSFGLLELLAMIIFMIGIVVAIVASTLRQKLATDYKHNYKGIIYGIFSGVLTSGQGFAYAYALPTIINTAQQQNFSNLSAANISWVLLFNGAFIPYGLFFLIKSLRQRAFTSLQTNFIQNIAWLILMSILYFICLILFSKSTLLVGHSGGVISWPLFMIFIILTSNAGGIIQGEWLHANIKAKSFLYVSICFMILAVLILAYNGYLNP